MDSNYEESGRGSRLISAFIRDSRQGSDPERVRAAIDQLIKIGKFHGKDHLAAPPIGCVVQAGFLLPRRKQKIRGCYVECAYCKGSRGWGSLIR